MLIVVDEDIPFAGEAFGRFGEVRRLASREMTPAALRGADALIVRSVTRVDAALLDGSNVAFVGTATAGIDHIDLEYLRHRGIAFADAAGANANAVAEYLVAALLHLRDTLALNLERTTLGVIGCGHVGRRVARYAAALGLRCVIHDPPLGRATCDPLYRPLNEILACDVVTVHVPLEPGGPDPTYHLVNDTFLQAMKPGSILINTSRGAVADTAALKRALTSRRLRALVLDVWENEPNIDVELAERCQIATAHIAGHTLDAKIAAVTMLAEAFAAKLDPAGTAPRGRPHPTGEPSVREGAHGGSPQPVEDAPLSCDSIANAVRAAFDIAQADRRLRDMLRLPPAACARAFDALRAGWPARREFHHRALALDYADAARDAILRELGFRLSALVPAGDAQT